MAPREARLSEDRVATYRDAGLWLDTPLARSLYATAVARDRAPALIEPERTLTFRELAACVRRCAGGLPRAACAAAMPWPTGSRTGGKRR